jgi:hypothetical protein
METGDLVPMLKKAGLVVCRHSNVAVDACRVGAPVVTQDGAAASIYPRRLSKYQEQPSQEVRQEFLERLAWWQWSVDEVRSGAMLDRAESQLERLDDEG